MPHVSVICLFGLSKVVRIAFDESLICKCLIQCFILLELWKFYYYKNDLFVKSITIFSFLQFLLFSSLFFLTRFHQLFRYFSHWTFISPGVTSRISLKNKMWMWIDKAFFCLHIFVNKKGPSMQIVIYSARRCN